MTHRHAELGRLNHFELLGVSLDADREDIRRAFQQNARGFHPDRLHGDDERLRPLAAAIFRRLTIAYGVLDDAASREHYRRQLERRGPTSDPPRPEAEADPDALYQAARLCLKRGRPDDARRLIRLACEREPERAHCQALRAWLSIQGGGELHAGLDAERSAWLLTRAIGERPDDLDLRMDRGRLLSRLGRAADAFLDFGFVARVDPSNVDAARELRLHHMRCAQKRTLSGALARFLRALKHGAAQPLASGARPRSP